VHSDFITPDAVRLFGLEQKKDQMSRATGIFPSDHFGVRMGMKSKKGADEFQYGMPLFAMIFLTLACCIFLGGIGYFAHSHLQGGGAGSAEENQKLTGDGGDNA